MDSDKLSEEAAVDIYRRRWGIEVFFRTLKQTFDRRKLRSERLFGE
jgi:IS4 transposase